LQQEKSGGEFFVTPFNSQSSGNLWGLGQANCLIVVEEQATELHKGDFVECIMI
jgi:molybdopterin biosynthesis enzyme